jgi:uncharacterized membrane protein (UPF0127 family)
MGSGMPRVTATNLTRQTCLGDQIEVAETSATRLKGLLGRDGLGKGEGLWIVPTEGVHTFRMRFALDLVFLNKKKQVTKIVPRLKPSRMAISIWAKSVLELPAGVIEETGTQVGDEIELRRHE